MTSDERALKALIDGRSPSHLESVAARDRVLRELRATPSERLTPRVGDTTASVGRWRTRLALAAILVLGVAVWSGIAWPSLAFTRMPLLESFLRGMAETAGRLAPFGAQSSETRSRFEEASVRVCDPDNLPPLPAGARGGGPNSFYMTPGRTYVLCMTPAALIRTAYGYGPGDALYASGRPGLAVGRVYGLASERNAVRVRGGPDWVRSERYTIEAVAGGAADGDVMQGPMLRALLEDRFKLRARIETEDVPAFDLVLAPGGLKIAPVGPASAGATETGACDPGPPPVPGAPPRFLSRSAADVRRGATPGCGLSITMTDLRQVVIGGAQPLFALGRALSGALGNAEVIDKTGITDLFNFVLEFTWDESARDRPLTVTPEPVMPVGRPMTSSLFSAIEDQLGLRLVPVRGRREFVVIEAIERPAPN